MRSTPDRMSRTFQVMMLAILCFAVYSNNYNHAYHLDSGYTLVDNPQVRSLANVPRFFSIRPRTQACASKSITARCCRLLMR